jgi:GTP-binding protein HflX
MREVDGPRPRAVVLGIQLSGVDDAEFASSLKELERLGHTLGLQIVARVTQRRGALANTSVVGEGKLKELAEHTGGTGVIAGYVPPGKRKSAEAESEEPQADAEGGEAGAKRADGSDGAEPEAEDEPAATKPEKATVVLVDCDLSPGQTRNLEKATGAQVLDRSMVILSIFQRHARTREARMQVEIAQLSYMAPRLRETGAGQDRQRGGIGGKGAGETALELDRRKIRDRIAELRDEIEHVRREADTRRQRRTSPEVNSVALVGYTNAGKSSLMRALTGDEVYVADQLFATLDTTVRVLKPETRPRILVSDTVGFIKKLPHDLVASFRSTLAEARDASLLLHLVDAADPDFREQYRVTREVLREIDADASPYLLILNKADKLPAEERAAIAQELPEGVLLSAKDPADVRALRDRIVEHFERDMEEAEFQVPFTQQRHVAYLHQHSRVLEERYDEDGAHLRVRAPASVLGSLRTTLQGGTAVSPDADPNAE